MKHVRAEDRRRITNGRERNMPRWLGANPMPYETTLRIAGRESTETGILPDPFDPYASGLEQERETERAKAPPENETRRYSLKVRVEEPEDRHRFRSLENTHTFFEVIPNRLPGEHGAYSVELTKAEYERALADEANPDSNLLLIEPTVPLARASIGGGGAPDDDTFAYVDWTPEQDAANDLTGAGVTVAVLDDGLGIALRDGVFSGRISATRSFIDGEGVYDVALDEYGGYHGSNMASLAVPPDSDLAFGKDGGASYAGDDSTMSAGIYWAIDEASADVINMSAIALGASSVLEDAVKYAFDNNVPVICAAGNLATSTPYPPASSPHSIAVTNYDPRTDALSPDSNFGAYVDFAAPGRDLYVLEANGSLVYKDNRGTSAACAVATNCYARILSGGASPQDALQYLMENARGTGADPVFEGHGVIQIGAAWDTYDTSPTGPDPPEEHFPAGCEEGETPHGETTDEFEAASPEWSPPNYWMARKTERWAYEEAIACTNNNASGDQDCDPEQALEDLNEAYAFAVPRLYDLAQLHYATTGNEYIDLDHIGLPVRIHFDGNSERFFLGSVPTDTYGQNLGAIWFSEFQVDQDAGTITFRERGSMIDQGCFVGTTNYGWAWKTGTAHIGALLTTPYSQGGGTTQRSNGASTTFSGTPTAGRYCGTDDDLDDVLSMWYLQANQGGAPSPFTPGYMGLDSTVEISIPTGVPLYICGYDTHDGPTTSPTDDIKEKWRCLPIWNPADGELYSVGAQLDITKIEILDNCSPVDAPLTAKEVCDILRRLLDTPTGKRLTEPDKVGEPQPAPTPTSPPPPPGPTPPPTPPPTGPPNFPPPPLPPPPPPPPDSQIPPIPPPPLPPEFPGVPPVPTPGEMPFPDQGGITPIPPPGEFPIPPFHPPELPPFEPPPPPGSGGGGDFPPPIEPPVQACNASIDQWSGGCFDFCGRPPTGFYCPTGTFGVCPQWQPGQPIALDLGTPYIGLKPPTTNSEGAVFRETVTDSCWSALLRANFRPKDEGDDTDVNIIYPQDGLPVRKTSLSTTAQGCLALLGWTEHEYGGIFRGIIDSVDPIIRDGRGPTVCVSPKPCGGFITTDLCFDGDVVTAIERVIGEMCGLEPGTEIIFDSECDKVLDPPVCFPAGTPWKTILDYMLKLCGFCVFRELDGSILVGHCTPNNVVWDIHEDYNLIGYETSEFSRAQLYAFVWAHVPDYIDASGTVVQKGFGQLIPVPNLTTADDTQVYDYPLPYGTTSANMLSAGQNKAIELADAARPHSSFAFPINSQVRVRDQARVWTPSRGASARYMMTKLGNDWSLEDGDLTKVTSARWLAYETGYGGWNP